LLGFIAPSYQNAIVARGSKLPGAKDEKLIVEASEDCPHNGNKQRPDNEEGLEVEVEQHASSSHISSTQVGFNWPNVALLTLNTRHEVLGTRTPSFHFRYFFCIDVFPKAAQVDHPYNHNNETHRQDRGYYDEGSPMLKEALPIMISIARLTARR